ncbi:hypothetical protein AAF712_001989 [Marasmius tenuissimus]|uniref:chitin deacetylase n=1 Tax=Marasmius tenuissimus TaxID=585030 RepID=A0ABR3AAQ9_9AGAR
MASFLLKPALFIAAAVNVANSLVIHDHNHEPIQRRYFDTWYQPEDHFSHALFKRGPPAGTDGASYPQVGSDDWSHKYPAMGVTPGTDHTPQEWLAQLKIAQDAGKIPNIPTASLNNGMPTYQGVDAGGPQICSSTYQCHASDVVYDSPANVFAISFDDGPLPPTPTLVDFLQKNNEIGTHFMIGSNILGNPNQFQAVFNYGGDCAVHTWSHPYMTTLSNEQIVAELGWTMQIIHDSTGGRVPKVWRPPYGDSDHRVRSIAKEVFGMTTVIWNQDSADWQISAGKQSIQGISQSYDQWLTGSKDHGLMILEHELSDQTVQAFMENYPKIKSNGWETASLARIVSGAEPYQNVLGDQVAPASIYLNNGTMASPTSTSASTSSTSSASSTSSESSKATVAANASHSNSATPSWKAIFSVASTLLSVAVPCLLSILP